MFDQLAYWIGVFVLTLGGVAIAIAAVAFLAWEAFEIVARRLGWIKMIWEWRRDLYQRDRAG